MLDRIRPRAVLVAACAVLAAWLGVAAPASAEVLGGPSPTAAPVAQAIGGPQLASRGVIVNHPSRSVPGLPDIKASAFVVADADTGQVLAAKDPHGWYRPASTLKMLTAVTLIPLLNPDSTVVASKLATSTVPNVVGLVYIAVSYGTKTESLECNFRGDRERVRQWASQQALDLVRRRLM